MVHGELSNENSSGAWADAPQTSARKLKLQITERPLALEDVSQFVLGRSGFAGVEISDSCMKRVKNAEAHLHALVEKRIPIYGVTTGFGDSCFRVIDGNSSSALQGNLVSYLLCGTGAMLPTDAARAMMVIRLLSLSRGFSGVSPELVERLRLFVDRDWVPLVPCEGSLGASGDLIPLAYLARVLQGEGQIMSNGAVRETRDVLREAGVPAYVLKPKEGLSLVNGTSTMAGMALVNHAHAENLLELSTLSTAWLCLALQGRTEPFDTVVNERASHHAGQGTVARQVLGYLTQESYRCKPLSEVKIENGQTKEFIQDRYSLRCAPQILGPVADTIDLVGTWLEDELSSASDNPLLGENAEIAMGGNFYGGYLSHGMDYLKISLAHMADMLDRQLATLIDEKSNRGLAPNLANWQAMPESERFLHHGLKGLHQAMSAITSEIMAKAMPNGIFSRSAESHNQDKVSLGMSAAVQCSAMIEQLYTVQALYLICLSQALDLRGIELKGARARARYRQIRDLVPFVSYDQPLDRAVLGLSAALKNLSGRKN